MSMKRSAELVPNKTSKRGSISIAEKYPEYIKEWSGENTFKPEDVPIGSNRKIKWICAFGDKWETRINRRKSECPACFLRERSVLRLYPNLAKEWHPENTCKPECILPGSSRKIKWICEKNHIWMSNVMNRTKHETGCPYCFKINNTWSLELIRITAELHGVTQCWIWPKDVDTHQVNFEKKRWLVHRLSLFLGKGHQSTPEKPHVAHSCGNHQCVNPDHLRIASAIENARDKDDHGTQICGQNHYNSKLTDLQAQEIRGSKEKSGLLAERYGVRQQTICAIRNGTIRTQDICVRDVKRIRCLDQRKKRIESITADDYKICLARVELESTFLDPIPNDSSIVLMTKCRLSKNKPHKAGYTRASVKGKMIFLHVLSAMIYHNDCNLIPKDKVIQHLCKNKGCFNHEHLKIGTHRANSFDAMRAGSKQCKLSEEQVKEIYLQKGKSTAISLAKQYDVDGNTISFIWKKRTWSHVTDKLD